MFAGHKSFLCLLVGKTTVRISVRRLRALSSETTDKDTFSIIPATLQVEGESNQFFLLLLMQKETELSASQMSHLRRLSCYIHELKKCQLFLLSTQFSTYYCVSAILLNSIPRAVTLFSFPFWTM